LVELTNRVMPQWTQEKDNGGQVKIDKAAKWNLMGL